MIHFVINPSSAGGRGKKIGAKLERALQESKLDYTLYFTRGSGDAGHYVQQIIENPDVTAVIAVGGDGTVHEVAQALIGTPIPLGFIPAGSGNDFARALNLSTRYKKAFKHIPAINTLEASRIDVARINDRYFVNGAGIGFDGAVAKHINESQLKPRLNRLKLGRFAYLFSALKLFFTFQPTDMDLIVDGKTYHFSGVWLIAVSNIPFYGGGMKICPDASCEDGSLDICIAHNMSRIHFLKSLMKVFAGNHVREPGVRIMRGKNIEVRSDSPVPVHTDGETCHTTPVHISIRSGKLFVMKKPDNTD
ncbi:MAG: diacylglycerol kinase family lipid kinase [Bacillaceae bacterium]|nr:diacylglycerol kinase family lipid kinase [Bacillaceae bacterium]